MTMQRARSGRPQPGEYADYAQKDFEFVAGDDAIDALESSRDETIALFRTASGPPYAPGKWTIKEILGHLIDDERVFAYRLFCVARNESKELPGFDEKTYADAAGSEQRSIESLLGEYQAVRASTIAFLESLTQEQWLRRGVVNGYKASVRGLAFHIASHELHHLRIIRERYS